jgi:NTP pyrophosphatase (non-canonical NTP hydrolase)
MNPECLKIERRYCNVKVCKYCGSPVETYEPKFVELWDVQELTNEIVEWATATFGSRQQTALPVLRHLQKEVAELTHAIETGGDEKTEFADCFMLLLESAHSRKLSVHDLVTATYQKLEINKKREWGSPDRNGVIEHI